MNTKKYTCSIILIVIVATMTLLFSSCDITSLPGGQSSNDKDNIADTDNDDFSDEKRIVTYKWYDADGTLLFETEGEKGSKPDDYTLPSDTDKWDYIKWKNGKKYERIAYRVPQNSYFTGNVFQIITHDLGEQPIGSGSAFVFSKDGWFVTNAHVMEDAYYAQAIFNIPNNTTGESYTYLSINTGSYYHFDKDIYIGKIDNYNVISSHYREIPLNLSYEIGDSTYSVGYPLSSIELIVAEGEITESWSDLYEKLYSGNSYICSSSSIAPGSSGGILTNDNLEVIGITTLVWFDENDEFLSGASISAFNINTLLQNTNENSLISLIDRFHENESVYIGLFNDMKSDEAEGITEKVFFEDGSLAYKYKWDDEGVNNDNIAFSSSESLLAGTDSWMKYSAEFYWEGGERRTISFYGYFDHREKFANFKYEFKYELANGNYYTVKCSEINYSPNVSLTLNRCEVDSSYYYNPTIEDITYAKEQFNYVYEIMLGVLAPYESNHKHSFSEWEVIEEATCDDNGEKIRYCYCGETESITIEATGHSFGDWFVTKESSESELGEKRCNCHNCEEFKTEVIPELSHEHSRWSVIILEQVSPTCTQTGLTQGTKCSGCKEMLINQEIVPALGHDYINHKAQKETCTNIGWESFQTCGRCDYSTYEEIGPLGHDFIDHEAQVETCIEIGWNAYQTCSKCDYSTYHEITPLGHSKKTVEYENYVEATCTEDGYYEQVTYCERCNEEVLREGVVVSKQGHSIMPTFTCSACNEYFEYYRDGEYVYFGEFPQSLKDDDIIITDEYDSRGYYLGSDGYRYAKVTANPWGYDYTFSTGIAVTSGTVYYFKVEPIRWRILSEDGDSMLILCDSIIANMEYNNDYEEDYVNSYIRSWLNYTFYEWAFSELQHEIIMTTTVDNSLYSAGYSYSSYANDDTEDKIFLLSYREVSNYDLDRKMKTTDYTRATGVNMSTADNHYGNGSWWLRSRYIHRSYWAWYVDCDGSLEYFSILSSENGVVPALRIKL